MPNPTAQANANIRAELARAEVSQAQVAALLDIPPSQVSARLKGRVHWKLAELQKLARHLNVPIAILAADDAPDAVPAESESAAS
jgi:transcriptional regulator with XRE-family HTH domain